MSELQVRCLAYTGDVCGEGCVWHPEMNSVFWADINRRLLHRYCMIRKKVETWLFDQPVTSVLLTSRSDIIALVLGGSIVLWNTRLHKVIDTLYELPEWPAMRCNDARTDPSGTLWFGTMQNNIRSDGSTAEVTQWSGGLYSLDLRTGTTLWQSGLGIANTLAWSPDSRTMYFGDTLANCIYRGVFDPVHSVLHPAVPFFHNFARGLPDGSAVDAEGFLWNCRYGGSCIVRVAPNGEIAGICEMPIANPTTCTFGGPDFKTLFITSAVEAGESKSALFSLDTTVSGLPTVPLCL